MADTSWEYVTDNGTWNDTSQDFEPVGSGGTVNEGAAAAGGVAPTGVLYGPLAGPMAGPI